MKIKEKLKHFLSFLLHGERPPIYARINVLKPDKRLWGDCLKTHSSQNVS